MKQRLLKSLALIAMLLASVNASAYDFEVDGIYYDKNSDDTSVMVSSGDSKYIGDIVIPETVTHNGSIYNVTGIIGYRSRPGAFDECAELTSVTIPPSIKTIETSAFDGCISLSAVYISDMAKWCEINFNGETSNPLYYAKRLYLNNKRVRTLEIPANITQINPYAFFNCEGLTSVVIHDNISKIGRAAFHGCTGLTSVSIGNGVKEIETYAFYLCDGLTEVHISDIAKWCEINFGSLGGNPLKYAKNLYLNEELITNLTVPEGVTIINDNTFFDCTNITSVTLPNSLTSIGECAFYGCTNLSSVEIPNNVTTIGRSAFAYCENLNSASIGNGVTSIGNYAFDECSNMTSVTIGSGVTEIGDYAFSQCPKLSSVHISDIAKWCGISFGNYNNANPLYYAKNLYLNGKLVTDLVIPDNTTNISANAFNGCTSIKSASINASLIGSRAFLCPNLTSVTIGGNVKKIGDYAFDENLFLINSLSPIPPVITSKTFYHVNKNACILRVPTDCKAEYELENFWNEFAFITESETPDTGGLVFSILSKENKTVSCSASKAIDLELVDIVIPSTVNIGGEIYTVTSIADEGFREFSSISSVIIPETVEIIGYSSFNGCSGLTNIKIGTGVKEIGELAFNNCKNLSSIEIPNNVTTIGRYAFSNCTNLNSASIGSGVTSIGDYAFWTCSKLKTINILNPTPPTIYDDTFYGVSKNSCVLNVPVGSLDAYKAAEYWKEFQNIVETNFDAPKLQYNILSKTAKTVEVGYSETNAAYASGDVVIPETVSINGETYTVTSISDYAFHNCAEMTSLTVPESVDTIGEYAFWNCKNLKSIKLPSNVSRFGASTFYNCESLTSITLPEGIKHLENTFVYCINLTSATIPNSVNSIGADTFQDCAKLASITIPENVSLIGRAAFLCCALTEVKIPNSVTTIEPWAFGSCINLASVSIGSNVESIGNYAFYRCDDLSTINSLNPTPPVMPLGNAFDEDLATKGTLYIPTGSLDAYKAAEYWKDFLNIVETDFAGINEVGSDNADENCPVEWFNLQGSPVDGDNLAPGIYLRRQGATVTKVLVN